MPPTAARPFVGRPLLARVPGLFAQVRHTLSRVRRRLVWPLPPATVIHVTHHKAGSQWVRRILEELSEPWVVPPRPDGSQFLADPIRPRRVYPTVYVTREQFESVKLPAGARRFVVIRDLRDTLVSDYFSLKVSHGAIDCSMTEYRAMLNSLGEEAALIRMIRQVCAPIAAIQRSWLNGPDEVLKYEDLLVRDAEILTRVLIDQCGLHVTREYLAKVVAGNRFEVRTGGRKPGAEDRAVARAQGRRGRLEKPLYGQGCEGVQGSLRRAFGRDRLRNERPLVDGSQVCSRFPDRATDIARKARTRCQNARPPKVGCHAQSARTHDQTRCDCAPGSTFCIATGPSDGLPHYASQSRLAVD